MTAMAAQSGDHGNMLKKYRKNKGVIVLKLPAVVFRPLLHYANVDQNTTKLMHKCSSISVLTFTDGEKDVITMVKKELGRDILNNSYKNIMQIKEEDNRIDVYVKAKDGVIRELLVMVNEKDEFVAISLKGKLQTEDILAYVNNY